MSAGAIDRGINGAGYLAVRALQPVRLPATDDQAGAERAAWLAAPHNDVGNASRFAIDHCRHVRYVPGPGWHVWDGHRWAIDEDGAINRLAEATAREIERTSREFEARANAGAEVEPKTKDAKIAKNEADAWKRNARHVMQLRGLRAMVEHASSAERLIAPVDAMDADHDVINVANGTIDLRTGELRPHHPADLITKLAPGAFDAAARSERFERFLHDLTGGNAAFAAYLQRAAGYTATGRTDEEVFFIAHGPAASGKSTFLEMLKAALGDYAKTAAASVFVTRRQTGASPDLARLPGARLVACSELGPGAEFTAETIKSLTGGDRIFARALYRDGFEYDARFKLWFATNELPAIDHDDTGMWRRVHALPFVHSVPAERRDPELKRRLINDAADQAAALAWIVGGVLAWRAEGLNPPPAVRAYTDAYRAASDLVGEWLRDDCELDPDARTTRAEARRRYEQWALQEGEDPLGSREFCKALRDHGLTEKKIGGVRHWAGLRLGAHGAHRAPRQETPTSRGAGARTRAIGESPELLPSLPQVPHTEGGER